MNRDTLINCIDSLASRLEAVRFAKDPEAKASALRRLSNAAHDVELEAARLAVEAEDERCASWDAENGFAVGPRATRISPPVDVADALWTERMGSTL